MQLRTRSKQQVLSDLLGKLLRLPPNDPDRPALTRMIEDLRPDLREQGGRTRPATHRADAMAETDQSAPSVERRRSPRRRVLLRARIVFRGGLCSMTGHIVGSSPSGVTLRPHDISLCPARFLLKPRIEAPPRECEVVWRKGDLVGVRYV